MSAHSRDLLAAAERREYTWQVTAHPEFVDGGPVVALAIGTPGKEDVVFLLKPGEAEHLVASLRTGIKACDDAARDHVPTVVSQVARELWICQNQECHVAGEPYRLPYDSPVDAPACPYCTRPMRSTVTREDHYP